MMKTVVPAGASSEMLDTVPIRKMRGLGRKLGDVVVSWSKAETASDLKVPECCEFAIMCGDDRNSLCLTYGSKRTIALSTYKN